MVDFCGKYSIIEEESRKIKAAIQLAALIEGAIYEDNSSMACLM